MAANTEASFAKINFHYELQVPSTRSSRQTLDSCLFPFCFSYCCPTHLRFLSAFNIKLCHPTTPISNLLSQLRSSTKRKSHSCLMFSLLSTPSMIIARETFLDNFYQFLHKILWNVLAHKPPTLTLQRHAKESARTARTCFTL